MKNSILTLPLLFRSVYHLGAKDGYRYWKLTLDCFKEPDLVIRWVAAMRKEADKCESSGDTKMMFVLRDFANKTEKHFGSWIEENQNAPKLRYPRLEE